MRLLFTLAITLAPSFALALPNTGKTVESGTLSCGEVAAHLNETKIGAVLTDALLNEIKNHDAAGFSVLVIIPNETPSSMDYRPSDRLNIYLDKDKRTIKRSVCG